MATETVQMVKQRAKAIDRRRQSEKAPRKTCKSAKRKKIIYKRQEFNTPGKRILHLFFHPLRKVNRVIFWSKKATLHTFAVQIGFRDAMLEI